MRARRRRLLVGVFAVWVGLLLASHFVRRGGSESTPLSEGVEAVVLNIDTSSSETHPAELRMAYRGWNRATPGTLPSVLLHGSPGTSENFRRLAGGLPTRSLLAPDLPGFGESSRELSDYSARAQARAVLALLDRLDLPRVHLVGFSLGGAVALEMIELDADRAASLTLLSAVGVQELELLGDYRMNHALHGLQLGAVWALHELTPHFGLLDGFPLDLPYARNFYDTDQRPLRGILNRLEQPTLIVHGKDDPLVPVEAAREHHRLVPHSRLEILPTDHFFLFRNEESGAARLLGDFWSQVETGEALGRFEARPARSKAADQPFDTASIPPAEGLGLFVMIVLLAASTLVSEDLTCIGAGLLVADGRLGFAAAAGACFAGIFVGDLLLFLAGRSLGRTALRVPPLSWWIREESVDRSSRWFQRNGPWVIGLSRFTPGARLPTYFAAGVLRTPFSLFTLYFALAAGVWTPALVALSAAVGRPALAWLERTQASVGWLLLGALVFLVVLRKLVLPLGTWSGRRRLLGAWRRWSRWEFWPRWLFYPPLLPALAALTLRYRSPTVFTCANPAIEDGGFVGESKAAILDLVGRSDPHRVAPWIQLPDARDDRSTAVARFAEGQGGWPIVLKPDAGERGEGVTIARTPADAREWLSLHPERALAQRYVPGVELGIFWLRHPEQERGEIFSVTEKVFPTVVGDGKKSIEELVLSDPRAVALAELYLDRLDSRRFDTPEAGEEVALAELGTHSLGAIFQDGRDRLTPRLEEAVEELSRNIPGFYFGRFDLRAPSMEALAGGRFHVVELNGVTSEATHIYDPRNSVLDAWRILIRQWSLAFAIGAANRDRGCVPTSPRALLGAALAHARKTRKSADRASTVLSSSP